MFITYIYYIHILQILYMEYSFGVPSIAIWIVHILTGLYFLWIGYQLTNVPINIVPSLKPHGLLLLVFKNYFKNAYIIKDDTTYKRKPSTRKCKLKNYKS
jgi:hypothetical protein